MVYQNINLHLSLFILPSTFPRKYFPGPVRLSERVHRIDTTLYSNFISATAAGMASAEDAPPQSIRSSFEAAEAKRRAVELSYSSSTSSTYASDLEGAISLYSQTLNSIAAASIFSPNEGIEDVSTTDIPLLLVSFYLAELVQRTSQRQPEERITVLRRARLAYDAFLDMVDAYGLATTPYDRLLERYRDDQEGFAVAGGPGMDAAARRNGKIASFRAEKELKEKLETLRRNPRYLDHGDEELVRELHLTNVTFALHTALNSLDSLNREMSLLASAPERPAADTDASLTDPLSRSRAPDHDPSLRLDQPMNTRLGAGGPLLSKEGRPLQPFTLLGANSRQELQRGTFRAGHNLPTMSIDEYLEEERRRGGIIEGGNDEAKPEVDEDDMQAVEREMYKARDWDDFKDENPKGSGNTLNMG